MDGDVEVEELAITHEHGWSPPPQGQKSCGRSRHAAWHFSSVADFNKPFSVTRQSALVSVGANVGARTGPVVGKLEGVGCGEVGASLGTGAGYGVGIVEEVGGLLGGNAGVGYGVGICVKPGLGSGVIGRVGLALGWAGGPVGVGLAPSTSISAQFLNSSKPLVFAGSGARGALGSTT